jgi:tetratricopeptide (TPR) repeat protein
LSCKAGIKQGAKIAKSDYAMDRIERLKEFLVANPEDNFVQHALALEYLKAGDENKARHLFETILTRDENYIGSYYHLAKLLEKMDDRDAAIRIYEKGMLKAKEAGDNHAYNELRSAYEEYSF